MAASSSYLSEGKDLDEPLILKSENLSETNVFKVADSDMQRLFHYENTYRYEKRHLPDHKITKSLHALNAMGGSNFLLSALHTSSEQGINGDKKDLMRRMSVFGTNVIKLPSIREFKSRFIEELKQGTMQYLLITAAIAILAGITSNLFAADLTVDEQRFTLEGYTIIMSVVLVVSATAGLLYIKDYKF